jgi:NAD(P)-dependent dehydrogenase (short-subunit alcohol dehydrogenase family)
MDAAGDDRRRAGSMRIPFIGGGDTSMPLDAHQQLEPGRDQRALVPASTLNSKELGRLDILIANAGIAILRTWDEVTPEIWRDTLDTNLTGVWSLRPFGIRSLVL